MVRGVRFVFRAEDGIRDTSVTGVQTCALPILPGCATGEEVYSLAICILEVLGNQLSKIRVQIFGTDLSESVIEHARAGIYPSAIEKDVAKARVKRFRSEERRVGKECRSRW